MIIFEKWKFAPVPCDADFTDIFKHWHISKIVIMTKTSVVSFLWLHKMNVCQIYPINNTVWILLYRYLPSWCIKCACFLLTFKCIVYNVNNVALYLKGACCCLVLIPFSQFFNALLIKKIWKISILQLNFTQYQPTF